MIFVCLFFFFVGCIGMMVVYFIFDIGKYVYLMNIKVLCLILIFVNIVFFVFGLFLFNLIFC